jgi:ABC-type lipoprotein release transport system permease subunit
MTWRRRGRHALVAGVLALAVFSLASVLLVSSALEHSLLEASRSLPELSLQRLRGGRATPLPVAWADELAALPGVCAARARVWGYAWHAPGQATLTLFGLDPNFPGVAEDLERVAPGGRLALESEAGCLVGPAVAELLVRLGLERLELRAPDGTPRALQVRGVLSPGLALWGADAVLVHEPLARELLGYGPEWATDLVAWVPNPAELTALAARLQVNHPDARVVTRAQQQSSTRAAFSWRGGWILLAGLVLLMSVVVLVLVQGSAFSEAEREELAVLRAVGLSAGEVLTLKAYEGLGTAGLGVAAGLGLALAHLHLAEGAGVIALLGGHAALRPGLELTGPADPWPALGAALACLTAVGLAGLVPAFRLAMRDPAEVLR